MKRRNLLAAAIAITAALSCNPEPKVVEVSEVKVEPSTLKLVVGESKQITAEVLPSNATDKSIYWGSSSSEVAIVSSDGVVVAFKPGTTNVSATAGEKSGVCAVTVEALFVPVSKITLSETTLEITEGEKVTLTATVEPDEATDPTVQWKSSDEKIAKVVGGEVTAVAEGSAIITAIAGEKSAECAVTVYPAYAYVDLGLSVNWGAYNLGASAPEELGNYYAWGELEPKEDYSWKTYKYCGDGSSQTITKYNTKGAYGKLDNLTVLQAEDDAATAQRGPKWRIPTKEEWDELYNNCSWVETTENGVAGFRITGKDEKSVFIPRSGFYEGKGLKDANNAYYWSTSLAGDPRKALYAFFAGKWNKYIYDYDRFFGMPVRAVTE